MENNDIGEILHDTLDELAKSLGIRVVVSASNIKEEFKELMDDAQTLLDRIHIEQEKPKITSWEDLNEYLKNTDNCMDQLAFVCRNNDGTLNEIAFKEKGDRK